VPVFKFGSKLVSVLSLDVFLEVFLLFLVENVSEDTLARALVVAKNAISDNLFDALHRQTVKFSPVGRRHGFVFEDSAWVFGNVRPFLLQR